MAISRGSMTKELTGNRVKKMAMGGMAGAAGAGDLAGRARGQAVSAMAKQGGMGAQRPMMPNATAPLGAPISTGTRPTAMMKKGGMVRGCGCAKRGTKGAKMV